MPTRCPSLRFPCFHSHQLPPRQHSVWSNDGKSKSLVNIKPSLEIPHLGKSTVCTDSIIDASIGNSSVVLKKLYNKQFKRDSARVAFLVCGDFGVEVLCRDFVIACFTP